MHLPLLSLPSNRVRRNYIGGALLGEFEGRPAEDGERPEDWIASTVAASNPGLPKIVDEGLALVRDGRGERVRLVDLFASAPEFYLGSDHFRRLGTGLGFLVKLLDSAIRLHLQAHPTAAFARQHLGSRWGKLEVYVILAVRTNQNPYIRLGFQRPPSPQEWRRIVFEQDIKAMDECFDRIPVEVGDVWIVPGGLPHAIGEGILMLEVMEPSDLVVRCEFERNGIVVPPQARYMDKDPEVALQIFDFSRVTAGEAREKFRLVPSRVSATEELLVGAAQTESFAVSRLTCRGELAIPMSDRLRVAVVIRGRGEIRIGSHRLLLRPGGRFLIAAQAPSGFFLTDLGYPLEVLMCSPGNAG